MSSARKERRWRQSLVSTMSSTRKGGGVGGEGRRRPGHGAACRHWCGNGGSFLFLSEDLLSQHYAKIAQIPILRCSQN
jgi:hypothetical protein